MNTVRLPVLNILILRAFAYGRCISPIDRWRQADGLAEQLKLDGRITLHVHGVFRVCVDGVEDHTPSSVKARALLALLALSPEHRRSRLWLQSKLWSDRTAEKAAASLRQCLVEVRRALKGHSCILRASRSAIEIDAAAIHVPWPQPGDAARPALLEGLDPKDKAFDLWLKQLRARKSGSVTAAPLTLDRPRKSGRRLSVAIELTSGTSGSQQTAGALIHDLVARSLMETLDVEVVRSAATGSPVATAALYVHLQTFESLDGFIGLRVRIEEAANLRCLWSASARLDLERCLSSDDPEHLGIVHGVVQAVADAVSRRQISQILGEEYDASVMVAMAVRKMFSMQYRELHSARQLLDQAIAIRPRGLYHAWRAQLATIRLIERDSTDIASLRAETDADIAQALETEPMNSNVLACVSNARLAFDQDHDSSLVLSRQSTVANPSNPLGWWALASATLYAGEPAEAYAAAVKAQRLANESALKSWADFQRSLTAAVTRRFEEAKAFGASSHAFAPHFRPPLRYLIALHARSGNVEAGSRAARKLRSLEQDFTVDRLCTDPTYPVSMMRRSNLVEMRNLEPIEDQQS